MKTLSNILIVAMIALLISIVFILPAMTFEDNAPKTSRPHITGSLIDEYTHRQFGKYSLRELVEMDGNRAWTKTSKM